jgi:Na+/melibiose symporter-like transporter
MTDKHAHTRISYQNVKGYSPLVSAALLLPLVVTQAISSTIAGFCMSKFNFYGYIIWGGFSIWLVGSGLLIQADKGLHIGWVCFFLFLVGTGTGMVFQPTLVALQAQTPKMQRAVVTSNRNFLRSSGGAVGLAVSSAILANVLRSSLPEHLSYVANSTFAAPDLSTFDIQDQDAIANAYASASRAVFIFCAPLNALCLALCVFIKDQGLIREEDTPGATTPAVVEEDVEKSIAEKSHDPSRRPSTDSAVAAHQPGVLDNGKSDAIR